MKLSSIIMAAGKGTRMYSTLPKVLHRVCGLPLIHYAIDLATNLGVDSPVVVIGHGAEQVKEYLGDLAKYAIQKEQLGTGHAVLCARDVLDAGDGLVLVTPADMPLFTLQTLENLVKLQISNPGPMSMLTVISENSHGFGRIVRNDKNEVQAIVEEAQATKEQLNIKELNVGAYCFDLKWLWPAIEKIQLSPKGEYYLTDLVEIAIKEGKSVAALVVSNVDETLGINNRVHLAEAEAVMRRRILETLMLSGVTVINPESTYIESTVKIGQDTIIQPNTFIRGNTQIGHQCEIGPNSIITDCKIGNQVKILAAVMDKAIVEDGVDMGPFARLRKGAHLGPHVHLGNFGEVKDSYLGEGTKMGHFSYIGNATIGKDVNIGAGTITCNYDGEHKHPTVIGDNVFIGSDTMLVAPIKIGKNAHTGAGAVVTHDVQEDETVVGVPAKPLRKKE